jgi:signal transduction histidine kinase
MKRPLRIPKLKSSLLSRYLLIVISAILLLPVVFPLTIIVYGVFNNMAEPQRPADYARYESVSMLEKMWHQEALQLEGASAEIINQRLLELSREYTRASMFWVDREGVNRLSLAPVEPIPNASGPNPLPEHWSAVEAIAFMKMSTARDPLVIVAFVGDRAEVQEGFLIMQVPRVVLSNSSVQGVSLWFTLVLVAGFAGFAIVSWLFFIGIRKRLLRLQTAMSVTGENGVPEAIPRGKPDEIGRLEEAFNTMVAELAASRQREAEEDDLRKRLVADLSHDLRTPLTVIRSHVHGLTKEELSVQGRESLKLMDDRISDLGTLIENLLSYNLLHSGRVTLDLQRKDILRLMRESAAAWYPLWEREGFEVDIDLEDEPLFWNIDEVWFRRILDNLYQNILRHARSGCYVGLSVETRNGRRSIVIQDHGQGIGSHSEAKGAGLGLPIVDLLLKQMELDWEMSSTEQGTSVCIFSGQAEI